MCLLWGSCSTGAITQLSQNLCDCCSQSFRLSGHTPHFPPLTKQFQKKLHWAKHWCNRTTSFWYLKEDHWGHSFWSFSTCLNPILLLFTVLPQICTYWRTRHNTIHNTPVQYSILCRPNCTFTRCSSSCFFYFTGQILRLKNTKLAIESFSKSGCFYRWKLCLCFTFIVFLWV